MITLIDKHYYWIRFKMPDMKEFSDPVVGLYDETDYGGIVGVQGYFFFVGDEEGIPDDWVEIIKEVHEPKEMS